MGNVESGTSKVPVRLIAGLGNPGDNYAKTRHNAGAWFVERLARAYNETLLPEKKFFGMTGRIHINQHPVRLLVPSTFMNCSGQAIAAMADFYRIPAESILIAHDELDFPPGLVRFKSDGGHGGHNGLRDIISKLGNKKGFLRLRLGIGHPGTGRDVASYVLKPPSKAEEPDIHAAIEASVQMIAEITNGNRNRAVQELHGFKP